MFSTLSRRWFSLFVSLLLVLTGLLPVSAAAVTPPFSVGVKADCLGCTLGEQFPVLRPQLPGEVPWTASTRHFGKRPVAGFAMTASADLHPPDGLKPLERRAWVAMAERGQMQLFLPQRYDGSTVVERGAVQVQLQPLGAQPARAERQGNTLVYKNAYPSTDSLQVIRSGRSEEFLYLRERSSAPQKFDYRVRVGQGVQLRSVEGSIAFVDSRGRGVRIDRPWLVDSSGRRSESAVHWQVLDGGRRLRLVVEPRGLSYPVVVDPSWTPTGMDRARRQDHTATLLPSGQVLVVGGQGLGDYYGYSSAELYDPQTGSWTPTGSMATARQRHTATLLPSGQVLVAGGISKTSHTEVNQAHRTHTSLSTNSAELYDPTSGTWTTTGSMSEARADHTETLLPNGKVLVMGGITEINDDYYIYTRTARTGGTSTSTVGTSTTLLSPTNKVELYNPTSGTWTVLLQK